MLAICVDGDDNDLNPESRLMLLTAGDDDKSDKDDDGGLCLHYGRTSRPQRTYSLYSHARKRVSRKKDPTTHAH